MHRLGSIVPLIFGLFGCYISFTLAIGKITNPGPGLWPFLLSLILVVLSILLFIVERTPKDFEKFKAEALKVVYGVVSLILFVFLFQNIGFIIPGFLTALFWLKYLGRESWKLSILISILVTVFFYLLFVVVFKIPFPDDILIP